MLYEIDTLKAEIRVALDQNMTSEQLFETDDIDTLTLDEIIESKIADAARTVELSAPNHLLDEGKAFGESVSWRSAAGYGSGSILLPKDFMRLVCFQMSDWDRIVTAPITEEHPMYAMQSSRFPGIRGCPQKPVVAIVNDPLGLTLEFYSCTAGANVYVKKARYIPCPSIEDCKIDICEKLRRSVIYRAASLVATTLGQSDNAVAMATISENLMQ